MTTWFISDTHFGEQPARRQKAAGLTASELDARILGNWRDEVSDGDEIWHLGDIGKSWRVLLALPGRKHLILAHNSDRRPVIAKSGVFATIQERHRLVANGHTLDLIHNPDDSEPTPGVPLVHGHYHYRAPGPGCVSVCVDHCNWGPVSLDRVLAQLHCPASA